MTKGANNGCQNTNAPKRKHPPNPGHNAPNPNLLGHRPHPTLQTSMRTTSPVLTTETTMWRCWTGFNATHSMALILFGLIYGYLALAHSQLLFRSPFLLLVGLATLASLVILSKLYFFRSPLIWVSTSLIFYIASVALSRTETYFAKA